MELNAAIPQLQHGAQHRETPARLISEKVESRQHRLRRGVVGLIQQRESPLLQSSIAAAGNVDLQLRSAGWINPQMGAHRQSQQQVAGVMTTIQRQGDRSLIQQETIVPNGADQVSSDVRVILQAHPQHPSLPDSSESLLQQRVAGGDDHHPLRMKGSRDLALGGGDGLATAQPPDVGGADVGDHSHIRFGAAGQAGDLPRSAHAHLNHQSGMVRTRSQHGEGHADVVVVVAVTGLNCPQRRQHSPNQLPGRGLAGGTGHGHQGQAELTAVQQRQLLVGRQGVIHPPVQQSGRKRRCPVQRHHSPLPPQRRQLLEKAVTIEAFPHQGNKEIAGLQLAAVGADRPNGLIRVHHSPLRFPPEINELLDPQGHAGATLLNRIMPLPTRADRPIN